MATKDKCNHEVSKQSFRKMFINDNGRYGGQVTTIILECTCGYLSHIMAYRGNVMKEYLTKNSGSYFGDMNSDKFETEIVHN